MKRVLAFLISLSVFVTCMSGLTASASDYDEQRRQYNSQSGIDCNYYGNKIVFIDSHKEKLILRNGLKGKAKKSKKSISSATVSVAYYKDYVFYIDEHTGYLKRYSTKNHKIKVIAKGDINSFLIACKRVVYFKFDPYGAKSNGLYECKLSGKGKRRITKNESSQMYSYKGNLYYKEYDVAAVKRYNFKKKKSYKVLKNNSLKKMQVFAMEGKYLYLLKDKGNINSLYKLDVSSKKLKKIGDYGTGFGQFLVKDGVLYAYASDGIFDTYARVYRYERDIGKLMDFTGWYLPSYESKARHYGLNLGFYKDRIITDEYKNNYPTGRFFDVEKI